MALVFPEGIETGENDAYAAIGRHLHERGVSVPEIFAYQRQEGFIVMEDAGVTSLYDKVNAAKDPHEIVALYEGVWDLLIRLQRRGAEGFQKDWCFQGACYDRKVMLERESGYFLDAFLYAVSRGKYRCGRASKGIQSIGRYRRAGSARFCDASGFSIQKPVL